MGGHVAVEPNLSIGSQTYRANSICRKRMWIDTHACRVNWAFNALPEGQKGPMVRSTTRESQRRNEDGQCSSRNVRMTMLLKLNKVRSIPASCIASVAPEDSRNRPLCARVPRGGSRGRAFLHYVFIRALQFRSLRGDESCPTSQKNWIYSFRTSALLL